MGDDSPYLASSLKDQLEAFEWMLAATDALPDLKQFGELPKYYPRYVSALRLVGKIKESPKPLTLQLTIDDIDIPDWKYEGEVDENGEACGYGVASASRSPDEFLDETYTISGSFRQGKPYGITVIEVKYSGELFGCLRYISAGEMWEGYTGRSTVYKYDPCDAPGPELIENKLSRDSFVTTTKTKAYYAEDGTERTCLVGACE